jgi:hypothetical protein
MDRDQKKYLLKFWKDRGGTWGTLRAFSGIFFLYISHEDLSGKWGLSAPCAPMGKNDSSGKNGDTNPGNPAT